MRRFDGGALDEACTALDGEGRRPRGHCRALVPARQRRVRPDTNRGSHADRVLDLARRLRHRGGAAASNPQAARASRACLVDGGSVRAGRRRRARLDPAFRRPHQRAVSARLPPGCVLRARAAVAVRASGDRVGRRTRRRDLPGAASVARAVAAARDARGFHGTTPSSPRGCAPRGARSRRRCGDAWRMRSAARANSA